MPFSRRRFLLTAGTVAAAAAAGACSGIDPAAVLAVVQPRTAAQALAEGRRLWRGGEWEAAIAPYSEAALDGSDLGLTARFELARLLDALDRLTDAQATLDTLTAAPGNAAALTRGWYLRGSVLAQRGEREGALAAYQRAIDLGSPAAAYARVARARLLSADGQSDAALAELEPVLAEGVPALARRQGLRLAGQIEAGLGRHDRALARYRALLDAAVWTSEGVAARTGAGAAAAALGDLDAAAEAWTALAARYPHTPEAERALTLAAEAGRPVDGLTAGIVHYRRRNNQQARDLFNAELRANGVTGTRAATALFFLGALAERRDDAAMALENYDEAFRADPTGPYAHESLWERANVFAYSERPEEARQTYLRLGAIFPSSRHAGEAQHKAAFLSYLLGRKGEARELWGAAMAGREAAAAAQAALWTGRISAEMGDSVNARLAWGEAVRREPAGLFGLRAGAWLAGEPRAPLGATRPAAVTVPAADWAAAESWLAGWAGPENTVTVSAVLLSADVRAGLELLELEQHTTGTDALEEVMDRRAREPWPLYRLARVLAESAPHLAYYAATRILAAAAGGIAAAAMQPQAAAIARLAYPAPWPELVQYYAGQYQVDPLLVYAMMRQESTFDPRAGSTAGAFGLTQVIPGTAAEIARALGKDGFVFGDLARPAVAIQFGAFYLGGRLKTFDGAAYQALAAYNGGGGNAQRWQHPGGPGDPDRFYEAIDFAETSLYLRTVVHNYGMYRYLYGAVPKPSLTTGGQ